MSTPETAAAAATRDTFLLGLADLKSGSGRAFGGLGVTPLRAPRAFERDYLTLDEALAKGTVHIGEISAGGSVPELRLENAGERPVLLLDGEALIGAKQNRILNLSILAPAKTTITIPVSCMEAGRWSHASRHFSSADYAFFMEGRAAKAAAVSASLRSHSRARSDQGEVWARISEKQATMACSSPTDDAGVLYERSRPTLDAYVERFPIAPGEVGAVFSIGGRIRGMEVLDHPEAWARLQPKILRSYAIDAMELAGAGADSADQAPDAAATAAFIARVAAAPQSVHAAAGEGEDLRLDAADLAGGGLVARGRVVHALAFSRHGGDARDRRHDRHLVF